MLKDIDLVPERDDDERAHGDRTDRGRLTELAVLTVMAIIVGVLRLLS